MPTFRAENLHKFRKVQIDLGRAVDLEASLDGLQVLQLGRGSIAVDGQVTNENNTVSVSQ